jgi:hypothetical protein
VPDYMLKRVKLYNTYVADAVDENDVNVTWFIKEELKLMAVYRDGSLIVKWLKSSTSCLWRFITDIAPCWTLTRATSLIHARKPPS